MRHATAVPHTDLDDSARLLHPKGVREAKMMGRWLRDCGYRVDLVLHSPFVRTTETAKKVAKRVKADRMALHALEPPDPYPFDGDVVWRAVLAAAGNVDHILLVTHGGIIQPLRDWLCGDPVGISKYGKHWAYASITHLEDGREHWFVTPKLVARTLGDEDKLETKSDEKETSQAEAAILRVAEHLLRGRKRQLVKPLNEKLARAVAARFRRQQKAVTDSLNPLIISALQEADRAVPAGILAAVAAAMAAPELIKGYGRLKRQAYNGGAEIAAGELEADTPDTTHFSPTDEAPASLDATTSDRIHTALLRAFEEGLTATAAIALVGDVFRARVADAPVIAEYEISDAFHQGQTDAARAMSDDIGEDVEKRWDAEDDACDDCLDCADEEWVDIDFEYPAFGTDDPPGHPHCRCGLSFRRALPEL